jgi:hypothetical protein
MAGADLGPKYSLAKRLTDLERSVRQLSTRDVLQNASIGAGGLTIYGGGSLVITGGGSISVPSGALTTAGSISAGSISAGSISAGSIIVGSAATSTFGAAVSIVGAVIVGGALSSASLSTGSVSASSVTTSGQVTSTGIIVSPGSRAFVVASGFVGAWLDGSGQIGYNPSGVEFKQDFRPAVLAPIVEAVLTTALIRYRMITDVEQNGDAATWRLGTIAQYMALGELAEWVVTTSDGSAINWEHFTIPLIATVQALDARLRAAGI